MSLEGESVSYSLSYSVSGHICLCILADRPSAGASQSLLPLGCPGLSIHGQPVHRDDAPLERRPASDSPIAPTMLLRAIAQPALPATPGNPNPSCNIRASAFTPRSQMAMPRQFCRRKECRATQPMLPLGNLVRPALRFRIRVTAHKHSSLNKSFMNFPQLGC